jgi:RHS repeat-associated protein
VATFRGTDATPKEVFVHHNAGLSGFGGSSYIDAVIFRDRDASTSWWEDAADGLREERIYYVQNWRADVSALLTDTGSLIQWVKYSAYGVPFMIPSGDIDSDGDFDLTDVGGLGGGTFTDRARQDVNLDGVSDFDDVLDALALHGSGTFGWGTLSAPQTACRRGYAGYEYDPVPEAQGRRLYHVRHRVYDADSGRWTRRDPLGYVDGYNVYAYVGSSPLNFTDRCGQSATAIGVPGSCAPPAGTFPIPNISPAAIRCVVVGGLVCCYAAATGALVYCNAKYQENKENACERKVYECLQSGVSSACKSGPPMSCGKMKVRELPCAQIKQRMNNAIGCAAARKALTDECYGGVDSKHPWAFDTYRDLAHGCHGLYLRQACWKKHDIGDSDGVDRQIATKARQLRRACRSAGTLRGPKW